MFKILSTLIFSVLLVSACGGGGGGDSTDKVFTVGNSDGTKYSCSTQATYDQCIAGSCNLCTCTVGCDTTGTLVKLGVTMTPTTLKLNEQADLTLTLTNKAAVAQTVKFKLLTATGPAGYNLAVPFSNGCKTTSQIIGGNSISATVVVPANNVVLPCEFKLKKSFTVTGSPVAFTLEGLDKLELDGSLPVVNVAQ